MTGNHTAPGSALKVRLFNAKFSPNLGDGLLSECLERALIDHGAAIDTWSIDLAGRNAYGDRLAGRNTIMAVLDRLSPDMRQRGLLLPLMIQGARKWRPHYATGLQRANCAVIGGGNLFTDLDLNFPVKVSLALAEARSRGLPVAIYGVGVAAHWSDRGRSIMGEALKKSDVRAVFVRDQESKLAWDSLFADVCKHEAIAVRDPGLLASECYPRPHTASADGRPIAGLGVISPLAIRFHAPSRAPSELRLTNWYVAIARGLIASGFKVAAFTNGSPEDEIYMQRLRPELAKLGDSSRVDFLEHSTPAEMCRNISSFSVLMAFRMHAIIAAFSYGVPTIALAWERKLESFMSSVGRSRFFSHLFDANGRDYVALAEAAVEEGVDETHRRRIILETHVGVAKLMTSLRTKSSVSLA